MDRSGAWMTSVLSLPIFRAWASTLACNGWVGAQLERSLNVEAAWELHSTALCCALLISTCLQSGPDTNTPNPTPQPAHHTMPSTPSTPHLQVVKGAGEERGPGHPRPQLQPWDPQELHVLWLPNLSAQHAQHLQRGVAGQRERGVLAAPQQGLYTCLARLADVQPD